jgi:hypothetical protein
LTVLKKERISCLFCKKEGIKIKQRYILGILLNLQPKNELFAFQLYSQVMLKKKEEKKNRDPKVVDLVEKIKKAFSKDKGISQNVVSKMQDLRNLFIEQEQPTLVKSIRLVYEYAEAFDEFKIDLWEEEGGLGSFDYYLGLLENSHNKYNKEEIKSLNVYLKARLAGEDAEFQRPEDDEDL